MIDVKSIKDIKTGSSHRFANFSRLFTLVLGLALTILLLKNIYTLVSSRQRISKAKQKVEELSNQNEQLKKQKEKMLSEEYFEKIARDKLGLAKEGETVVILPDEETLRSLSPRLEDEGIIAPLPNWRLWLNLFL